MAINHEDYQVEYDKETGTIVCRGSFRLRGSEEYKPILELMISAIDALPTLLTLDVCDLQFLNSSGITTLSKFIIQVRKQKISDVVIKGSAKYPWQSKSLKNFQRLLPGLRLEID